MFHLSSEASQSLREYLRESRAASLLHRRRNSNSTVLYPRANTKFKRVIPLRVPYKSEAGSLR